MTILDEVKHGWVAPTSTEEQTLRQYSTTGDVLSFRRCRRQYGMFQVRRFSSSSAAQRYFGTLVHDVLDDLNRAYAAEPEGFVDMLAAEDELEATVQMQVEQAHQRLRLAGIRTHRARDQQAKIALLLRRFLVLFGESFFSNVKETEFRLQRTLQTQGQGRPYILDGIVDVLTGAVLRDLGLRDGKPGDVEIWDYKSGRFPDRRSRAGKRFLADYTFQMQVYGELYKQQTGRYPARCVLLFLGELGDDEVWNHGRLTTKALGRLIYEVPINAREVKKAMGAFHQTVDDIETEREKPFAEQWRAPEHPPDRETCDGCELRFRCESFPDSRKLRNRPLV